MSAVIFVKQGGGTPSSRTCLAALQQRWRAWAGGPTRMVLDSGVRNGGVFLQWVKSQGIDLRDAGVEVSRADRPRRETWWTLQEHLQ
eukprot:5303056-Pyramimonas_sp.AAC.1